MKLSPKGIAVGGILDVVLSALLGAGLGVYVFLSRGLGALPDQQLEKATMAAIHASATLYAIQLAIGIGCSVLGGYVAARIAKQDEIPNALLASWLCVGIGVYALVRRVGMETPLVHIVLIAGTLVAYFCGGLLAKRRRPQV